MMKISTIQNYKLMLKRVLEEKTIPNTKEIANN